MQEKNSGRKQGVAGFLTEHAGKSPVSFHMPGHKGAQLYRRFGYGEFLDRFFDCDITEIIGADNLFQPEEIIAETMGKYRRLYDSAASYLLVNGTSGGIIASILASVPAGKKLIMARNCHKSVFNALGLGGIQPVYAYASEVSGYGIAGQVEPEEIARLLQENPDAEAVILPSPNYYGICSDIRAIADVVHAAGKILIVDQAHGAHLKFFEGMELPLPDAAESCGADLVINSIHKTLGSLTQSAVLNVGREGLFAGAGAESAERAQRNLYRLEDKLQAIESTSPSYILMGSLDINADILLEHGDQLMKEWKENLEWFYAQAEKIPGLKTMQTGRMDRTKINLDMSGCGLDGGQLEQELLKYDIYAELVTGNILMCMTGIGNTREDYERLLAALQEISAGAAGESAAGGPAFAGEAAGRREAADSKGAALWTKKRAMHRMPAEKEAIHIDASEGRICAASIIPYPPGIPLICPGEEIGVEEIAYVKELRRRGEKVMGIDGEGMIVVGK